MNKAEVATKITSWSVYAVIAAGVFTGRWFASGAANTLFGAMDALFVAGIVVVLLGALTLVTYFGAFDMFAYGFSSIIGHMGFERFKLEYKDYPSYLEAKREKRAHNRPYFLPYTVIGGALLLTSLIIYIVLRTR